jgi:hypothetical protein
VVEADLEGIVAKLFTDAYHPKVARWHKITGCPASTSMWKSGTRRGLTYETLAICRTLALARAAFDVPVEEKRAGRFMIRSGTRVVQRHPEGDW